MALSDDLSLQIQYYKCIGEEPEGFAQMKPINLIIGRNNTGKSTLLDLLEFATGALDLSKVSREGRHPRVSFGAAIPEAALKRAFPESYSGGAIGGNFWAFAKPWIGARITWSVDSSGKYEFLATDPPFPNKAIQEQLSNLVSTLANPFAAFSFRRLLADRDVVPEPDTVQPSIAPNGAGLTNTIQHFVNKVSLPSDLVERTLLAELNKIFEPDAHFTDIVVQQLGDGRWELYLEEATKGRVSLSNSGSGVKTVLLVLAYLYLTPYLENRSLGRYLFGLEELENNLHPALQRRLLLYLRSKAEKYGTHFFFTTHSNIAIDLFANDSAAQIIHVTHNGNAASAKVVKTYVENCGVLDDLDVRASDLLQSNSLIWVEGPSDRLYLNRWIELWSKGTLREGAQYQCVFYGGRLLSHLSAQDPTVDASEVVQVLGVNRHAVIVMDSDKSRADDVMGITKQRLIDEIQRNGGLAWVTLGREVENYLPVEAIQAFYGQQDLQPLKKFEDIAKYLERVKKGEGKRFERNKVVFAERMSPHLSRRHLETVLDWTERLTAVCTAIRRWNRLPEESAA